jgi:hypothetical protein
MDKGVVNEIKELIDLIVNGDSYLKGKLNNKEVSVGDVGGRLKDLIKNENNKEVKEILKKELDNLNENRFETLIKKYGVLLFNNGVLRRNKGLKDDSVDVVMKIKKNDWNGNNENYKDSLNKSLKDYRIKIEKRIEVIVKNKEKKKDK